MSRLSNLFSGSSSSSSTSSFSFGSGAADSDSNDFLKYSAPKEPGKKGTQQQSTIPISSVISSNQSLVALPLPSKDIVKRVEKVVSSVSAADIPIGPSKVIASAAVRLFRANPTTNEFEGVENGSPLGSEAMVPFLRLLALTSLHVRSHSTATDDPILTSVAEALVGCKKGQKIVIGISPDKADALTESGTVISSEVLQARMFANQTYLAIEVEVMKVKTSTSTSEKDKEKDRVKIVDKAETEVAVVVEDKSSSVVVPERKNSEPNIILDRMKKVAGPS
eukprot:gene33986-43908_t